MRLRGEEVFREWEAAGIDPQYAYQAILQELRRRIKRGDPAIHSMREFDEVVRRAAAS